MSSDWQHGFFYRSASTFPLYNLWGHMAVRLMRGEYTPFNNLKRNRNHNPPISNRAIPKEIIYDNWNHTRCGERRDAAQ